MNSSKERLMELRETLTVQGGTPPPVPYSPSPVSSTRKRGSIVLQVIGWVAVVVSLVVPFLGTGAAVGIGIVLIARGSRWSGAAMIATSLAFTALITAVVLTAQV